MRARTNCTRALLRRWPPVGRSRARRASRHQPPAAGARTPDADARGAAHRGRSVNPLHFAGRWRTRRDVRALTAASRIKRARTAPRHGDARPSVHGDGEEDAAHAMRGAQAHCSAGFEGRPAPIAGSKCGEQGRRSGAWTLSRWARRHPGPLGLYHRPTTRMSLWWQPQASSPGPPGRGPSCPGPPGSPQ
jgi:hypothetical protein